MKRYLIAMVLNCVLMFVFWLGYAGLYAQDANKSHDSAESIEQLSILIEKALKDNDVQKLEEIKIRNQELVRGNLSLTVQKCNTLLDDGIKNELPGESEKGEFNFKIVRVMAEMYQCTYKNSYLMDKVELFGRWGKEEKEKYLEAEKYYGQGEEDRNKYSYETAVPAYNRGLDLYREIRYKEGEAKTLKRLGDVYYQLDKYEQARENYEEALAIFRNIKTSSGEAYTLRNLGDVHYQLDEYKKARECYEQSLVIFRVIKDISGEACTLRNLGDVYYQLDEYEKTREKYEESKAIYCEIKDRLGEANCLKSLGDVHRILSEYEKAREKYEQGLVIFREIKDRLGEANCLQSLGDMHRILCDYEKARVRYEEGLAIYREIKDRLDEANCLQSLGDVDLRLSEYEKARERYEQGMTIKREIKDRLGQANCLKSLGDVDLNLSEYKKARKRYEQGMAIYHVIKARLGEANCLQRLGDVYYQLAEYEKAREKYEQGLRIFCQIKAPLGEANCLQRLGDVYSKLVENKKTKTSESNKNGGVDYPLIDKSTETNPLKNSDDVHQAESQYGRPQPYYEEGFSINKEIEDIYGNGSSCEGLRRIYEAMDNFSLAERAYKNCIYIIEKVCEKMKLAEFRSPYLSGNIAPYENLIRLFFKQGKGAKVFPYAERSKARSFLYLLGNKRIDIKKGVPLNLVRQEEELRQKIVALAAQIIVNEKKEPGRRSSSAQFNNEMLQFKHAHSEILEKIKLQCPEYANMISVNPLSLEEIQTLIRESGNTVFLEYYTTPDAAYLWVLDGKDIFSYKIDMNKETLHKKVREYYTMIATPDAFGVATLEFQARELYNLLLKPVETRLTGKTRIAVIPHGVLHYLPFEALMNNGKFLEEQDMTFFYLPSASVYKYCRDKNPLKKEQLIALGNPDGSLPFSGHEVEELKGVTNLEPKIFIGKEATETNAKTEGPYADILHFSCHGVFDSVHPMYSALKLAADDKEDGNLEVQEIFQLNLKPAYLVTLSACETNVGSIKSGDEIVVMSRAFMYAGTPSVLASLWKVDDYYTEKLMVSFYRALKDTDKITALHLARKEMMEKYGKKHPFYWAPFVLSGDFR